MSKRIFIILLLALLALTACSSTEPESTQTATVIVEDDIVIDFNAPMGVVAGYEISWEEFFHRVQFQRLNVINTYVQYYQKYLTIDDPELQISYVNYLNTLTYQLDTYTLGATVLNDMAGYKMMQQQAEGLGYYVTEEDIDLRLQQMFGYGVETETNQGMSIEATPTPYTYEMYETYLAQYLEDINEVISFTEQDLRNVVREKLYEEILLNYLDENLNRNQDMVYAKHILVETEDEALDLLEKLDQGADWDDLAVEYSLDSSNAASGGDLGWFTYTAMVEDFAKVAFSTDVDKISEPVETQFGWHLIYVLGHEEQEMSDEEYYDFREEQLNILMQYARNQAGIEFVEGWENYIPDYPQIPEEYLLRTE